MPSWAFRHLDLPLALGQDAFPSAEAAQPTNLPLIPYFRPLRPLTGPLHPPPTAALLLLAPPRRTSIPRLHPPPVAGRLLTTFPRKTRRTPTARLRPPPVAGHRLTALLRWTLSLPFPAGNLLPPGRLPPPPRRATWNPVASSSAPLPCPRRSRRRTPSDYVLLFTSFSPCRRPPGVPRGQHSYLNHPPPLGPCGPSIAPPPPLPWRLRGAHSSSLHTLPLPT